MIYDQFQFVEAMLDPNVGCMLLSKSITLDDESWAPEVSRNLVCSCVSCCLGKWLLYFLYVMKLHLSFDAGTLQTGLGISLGVNSSSSALWLMFRASPDFK